MLPARVITYMNPQKYLLCLFVLTFTLNVSVLAQDIHFSQYNLTPMLINPAQAGAYKNLETIISYRTQWTSITPNAYRTAMFTGDGRLMHKKWEGKKWFATGLDVFSDKAGDGEMGTTQAIASLAYHTLLSKKSTLGGALFGGYAQRSIDYTNLTWDEQYQNGSYNSANPTGEDLTQVKNKFGYADVGVGVLYQYNKDEIYSKKRNHERTYERR